MAGEKKRYLQGSGRKADEIPDNTTSEGEDNGFADARVGNEEILDFCPALFRFYGFSGGGGMGEEP